MACQTLLATEQNPFVSKFPATGGLDFVLRDHLDHPLYWWPRTLLQYRVRFDDVKVTAANLYLESERKPVPFQLSDVHLRGAFLESAVVCFFSDLPAGGERRFRLTTGTGAAKPASPGITERREGRSIILDTGAVQVRIPAVLQDSGPIQQFFRAGRWLGASRLVTPGKTATSFEAVAEERGPIFTTYRLRWEFGGGVRYTAHVQAIEGYDFVYLREQMEGWKPSESARVEFSWSGFHPTHRQAPNHPYQKPNAEPGYGRYDWETIDQGAVGTQHGVSSGLSAEGEMPFSLGPYQPWGAYVVLTSANFWDTRTGDAAGLFIDRIEQWQDHEYAIWNSSPTLQVRYFYRNGEMLWTWPLATGTRSTGLAVYDHAKDIAAMEDLDRLNKAFKYRDGLTYRANLSPMSHTMFLQNRYGTIDLDLVKDWVLDYPASAKRPAKIFGEPSAPVPNRLVSAAELERRLMTGSELFRDLPTQGTRQNAGFAPVPSRSIYDWMIDSFDRLDPLLSVRQRERLDAANLILAYTHSEEDYMPMKTMLSGHPNFLSDVKSAPALFGFLYPDHPMTAEWADEFGKFLELNTRYHTRPPNRQWDGRGGRWTENLGTYVWGFVRPAIRANYVTMKYFDGKNRFALQPVAELGNWLVDALSAPFAGEDIQAKLGPDGKLPKHDWGIVTPANGPRRLHPPQGAHSARRMPPRSMWLLGTLLRNFDPLTAEHMMWAARPGDEDAEEPPADPWRIMFDQPDNRGTNPHLESTKYIGYGITLRAGVDTPGEVSLHLQQIDEGPNYRWGTAGEGGCGVLYYYAGGKSYSHNAREDVGDRATHDTDFCTNFGVWRNGAFRSVGRNALERPLLDLGRTQFAELVPRRGSGAYAWPEYQSRSVLMAGTDYFAVYDHVFNDAVAHRFSWFTDAGDEMPVIQFVKGAGKAPDGGMTQLTTATGTRGIWNDGMGDSFAVVTHRKDLRIVPAAFGAVVSGSGWTDRVFRNPAPVVFRQGDTTFEGTAGVIRESDGGDVSISVFDGKRASTRGVSLEPEAGMAVSADVRKDGIRGTVSGRGGLLGLGAPGSGEVYIDGSRVASTTAAGIRRVQVPAGRHEWEFTSGLPHPMAPRVSGTEDGPGLTTVLFTPVAGADAYRAELSRDGGASWQTAATVDAASGRLRLDGLRAGEKIHVRLVASNRSYSSAPGPEYPVYVTNAAPAPPDGLHVVPASGEVAATWGEVLGVREYRLYRRTAGAGGWQQVYRGPERSFRERVAGVVPAYSEPGLRAAAARGAAQVPVYEYAVSSVNGNGEGKRSPAATTDPASWQTWDPKPGERFRRAAIPSRPE